jgi:hypothetical protein
MADADSVTPGLATLLAQGWDVTEPGEGGRWGGLPPEIPANIAGPLSQMLATVSRLGGRAYIPWSPAIGPSVFGNSDGSGGVPGVGGAVGLLLDSSNGWGFAGPELVADPSFDTPGYWTPAGSTPGWVVSGGVATVAAPAAGNRWISRPALLTIGAQYVVTGNVSITAGAINIDIGAGVPNITSSGQFSTIVTATATTFQILANPAFVGSVSDVSVRPYNSALATALTQATGINKPLLASGVVPWAGALVFDGSNDQMVTANLAPAALETFIAAFSMTSLAATADPFNRGTAATQGTFFGRVSTTGAVSVFIHDGTAQRSGTSSAGLLVQNVPSVVTWVKGASRAYCRHNQVEVATTPFIGGAQPAAVPLGIGIAGFFTPANYQLPGIWVPSEVSAADLAVLERGAAAIAGLPI